MTAPLNTASLVSELRTIAEYACWDKFEDRFTSDPKKHPAWRAAAALESTSRALSEKEDECVRLRADIECLSRRLATAYEAKHRCNEDANFERSGRLEALAALKASEERGERLREALLNARGLIDTPLARRRHRNDPFYDDVVASLRAALPDPGTEQREAGV